VDRSQKVGTSRLVVAPNWIGDSVMAIPFVRALLSADPETGLVVMARSGPAAIFRSMGASRIIPRRESLASDVLALRREKLSEAWLLPNSNRAALTTYLAGIPERIGFDTDFRGRFLTDRISPPDRRNHQLRDYDALLSARGLPIDGEPPRLPVSAAAQERADRALARAGLGDRSPLVLLAPGAAFGWTKRWPADRFAALADQLVERDVAVGIAIGPGEGWLASAVTLAARRSPAIVGEDLDPVELAGAFRRARVVVANDSGPMHLAAAVGSPVVAFFGPTDPGRTAPVGVPTRVLDRYLFCSPCFLRECPYAHECMREIRVEDAARAVEELIGGTSQATVERGGAKSVDHPS
jgi:heptosyltransferase-2